MQQKNTLLKHPMKVVKGERPLCNCCEQENISECTVGQALKLMGYNSKTQVLSGFIPFHSKSRNSESGHTENWTVEDHTFLEKGNVFTSNLLFQ